VLPFLRSGPMYLLFSPLLHACQLDFLICSNVSLLWCCTYFHSWHTILPRHLFLSSSIWPSIYILFQSSKSNLRFLLTCPIYCQQFSSHSIYSSRLSPLQAGNPFIHFLVNISRKSRLDTSFNGGI